MGIKTVSPVSQSISSTDSEKPPHHMGIKTSLHAFDKDAENPLKNLPTTWGLRPIRLIIIAAFACISEKPPHHMGIKTTLQCTIDNSI